MNLTEQQIFEKVANQELTDTEALELIAKLHAGPGVDHESRQHKEAPTVAAATHATESHDASEGLQHRLERYLVEKIGTLLKAGSKPPDTIKNFMELGVESSQLIELTQQLEQEFGVELYPTLFFEYQNIHELAGYFSEEYPEESTRYFALQKDEAVHEPDIPSPAKPDIAVDLSLEASVEKLTPGPLSFQERGPGGEFFRTQSGQDARAPREDIAVIGMAGRVAGSSNLEEFWQHLRDKTDLMTEIPPDRWDYGPWFDENKAARNKTYSKWGSFVDDAAMFDPLFFGISPKEATWMDPQLRMLLEVIQETIEDAGYGNSIQGTNTGIYVGVMFREYWDEIVRKHIPLVDYQHSSSALSSLSGRVAYNFDLQGGSIPLDNACASSLTALHLACNALQLGESDMAFVAGVNLLLSPLHYVYLSRLQAVSPTGRCHTFDEKADGYTPGEGVVAVLLKPLAKAIADGDNIHAVIKGTAINHAGRSNNPTAPRPELQTRLVLDAWKNAGINPEQISYLEAHGTGTTLGDPIEINALKKAFSQFTQKEHFCAIGSAKAHLGHLESTAGIAGVVKVILSMKHNQIPAMPKFERLNPYLKLDGSPLYINSELQAWETESGIPKMAGVSSFGMTGNNAHVVIEEYTELRIKNDKLRMDDPQIIVLSAGNEERLHTYAERMVAFLENTADPVSIADMAYTLQVGREAMEERLALIAHSAQELTDKLKEFLDGHTDIENLYQGPGKRAKETSDPLTSDANTAALLNAWLSKGEYAELLEQWVQGVYINWSLLYTEKKPRKISLPTYPFAKEHYWIPEAEQTPINRQSSIVNRQFIHPLLHENTSDIYGLRFSSTFTGQEFFLKDHVVRGQRLLPGAAYLEMAGAAGNLINRSTEVTSITEIVLVSPVTLEDGPRTIEIQLYPENERVAFEVISTNSRQKQQVHVQGKLRYNGSTLPESGPIDIQRIRNACGKTMSGAECYKYFQENSFQYGPGFRIIEEMHIGKGEALSRLRLPENVRHTFAEYRLHPAIIDGALQTVVGLLGSATPGTIYLPFALQEVEIIQPLSEVCYAYVTTDTTSLREAIKNYDITIVNEAGEALVKINNFSARAVQSKTETTSVVYYESVWENAAPKSTENALTGPVLLVDHDEKMYRKLRRQTDCDIILVKPGKAFKQSKSGVYTIRMKEPEDYSELLNLLKKQKGLPATIVHLWAYHSQEGSDHSESAQNSGIYSVFYLTKALLEHELKTSIQCLFLYPEHAPQHAAVSGFARTVTQENPKLIYKTIAVPDLSGVSETMLSESVSAEEIESAYREKQRFVKKLREIGENHAAPVELRKDGVYLITGGLGKLGMIFAGYLSREVNARVVLVDRIELDEQQADRIRNLSNAGSEVTYLQGDISSKAGADNLIQEVKDRYQRIHGIIHGAGATRNGFIINKTREDIETVLAPKVSGTIYLDEATKDEDLDFFMLFSSLSGIMGFTGQSDYAYANAFMDHFAVWRESLRTADRRRGKTISIDWPIWAEGGMGVDQKTAEWLKSALGLMPLETQHGIEAFEEGLKASSPQFVVAEGIRQRIQTTFDKLNRETVEISKEERVSEVIEEGGEEIKEQAELYLKELLAEETGLNVATIRSHEPLEKYGIDSLIILNLNRELEEHFGELSKTLFFEYQTISELAGYFIENHREKLVEKTGLKRPSVTPPGEKKDVEPVKPVIRPTFVQTWGETRSEEKDIAVIGMSGRYPLAKDLDTFWENLRQGRDCITEIPQTRWNYQQYFAPGRKQAGKIYHKWGGFVDDADKFDPLFFKISPREAELTDPQARLFLETVWHTIEDAAYTMTGLWGKKVGVFAGVMYAEYMLYGAEERLKGNVFLPESSFASIANRISYYFNFKGPSIGLDTMCSSSLTAIHLAAESIKRGESEMAIAGGVNLSIHPYKYLLLSHRRFASTDGRCRSFGEGGDGYVPGEGVGAVLLKPLSKAIADGDHIYGIIKATALNHGGKTNGYTVPNPNAQASVIGDALKVAGIDPRTISYLEAHGTGTSLGDPIEVTGLTKTFREYTQDTGFCSIGSVKSNIGHCESAAGIAGVTKVLLQLQHRQLVPSLHSDTLNSNINFTSTPFVVQQQLTDWTAPLIDGREIPRRAGISAFGAGGANAHIIIEEYIPHWKLETRNSKLETRKPAIIVLSAKNEEQLREQAKRLLAAIRERQYSESDLADMAYTLQVGREGMEERLCVIVRSIEELEEKLQGFSDGEAGMKDVYRGQVKGHEETLAIFETDEDLQQGIAAWIAKGKYAKLADLWVKGLMIDWRKLYAESAPRRISLPTYPFARERFWAPESENRIDRTPSSIQDDVLQFDEEFYNHLLNDVVQDRLSVDAAVQKIKVAE